MKKIIIAVLALLLIATYLIMDENEAAVETDHSSSSDTQVIEQPENSNKESWKLYTNEEYGFSFSYPETCDDVRDRSDGRYGFTCEELKYYAVFTPQTNTTSFEDALSARRAECLDWLKENGSNDSNPDDDVIESEINGYRAISYPTSCGTNFGSPTIHVVFSEDLRVSVGFEGSREDIEDAIETISFK